MPSWCWIYLVLLASANLGGLLLDLRDREPRWRAAVNVLNGLVLIGLCCAYYRVAWTQPLLPAAPVLWALALAWDATTIDRELSQTDASGPAPKGGELWLVGALAVALVAPAYTLGGLLSLRVLALQADS